MRIGIDLGGTKIEGILVDDDGRERRRVRTPTPVGAYPRTIDAVCRLVAELDADTGARASVGVGIPGALSLATGRVKNANATWLNGQPFDRDLSRALGRPVRVANDANCFALSEAVDGAAKDAGVVFGVIIGTGVGGGVVVDGRLLSGQNAIAGEWGHNPLPWPTADERGGRRCYCGRQDCVETFLSGPAISAEFRSRTGRVASPTEIQAHARAGCAEAAATLAAFTERLAKSLAVVINIIDPDAIVLGGGLSNFDWLYDSVPALLPRWVFSDQVTTRVCRNRFGDSSGVRGAAWLWPAAGGGGERNDHGRR